MEFRLTYEGLMQSTEKDALTGQHDGRAEHKHAILKVFHAQLKRLWEITPYLNTGKRSGPRVLAFRNKGLDSSPKAGSLAEFPPQAEHTRETLAKQYALYGFSFVPLVTRDLNLICGLEILFLRPDIPGNLVRSGDIDNRLKTLFDALRIPVANENYASRTPEADESPFYCLLEDDSLITKVAVETDQLLQFVTKNRDVNEVRLVITVRLRPYELHLGNIQFG